MNKNLLIKFINLSGCILSSSDCYALVISSILVCLIIYWSLSFINKYYNLVEILNKYKVLFIWTLIADFIIFSESFSVGII